MDPQAVAALIAEGIPGSEVQVRTDGAGHYEAVVVSETFDGERTLKRHQRVYGTLGSLVGNELHALNIKTFTPDEWQARAD